MNLFTWFAGVARAQFEALGVFDEERVDEEREWLRYDKSIGKCEEEDEYEEDDE